MICARGTKTLGGNDHLNGILQSPNQIHVMHTVLGDTSFLKLPELK